MARTEAGMVEERGEGKGEGMVGERGEGKGEENGEGMVGEMEDPQVGSRP